MKLSEMMSRNVQVVSPEQAVVEAAIRMRDEDVGAIPVCQGKQLVGMLTDRDIVIRAVADKRDLSAAKVSEVMSEQALRYAFEDDDLEDAAKMMAEHQIRRLPILDKNRDLVGIVSLGDVARSAKHKLAGKSLEGVSQPS